MKNPRQQFDQNIAAASSYAAMYRELRKLKGLGARGRLDAGNLYLLWLPRGAIVAALSALDAYIHQVLYERVPRALADPNAVAESLADMVARVMPVKNASHAQDALAFIRAADGPARLASQIKDDVLQYASYQSPDKVIAAFGLLGVPQVFDEVAAGWTGPNTTADEIKDRLARYAVRRNQIAHEGDLDAQHRARAITPDYAEGCVDYVTKLVTRLDAVLP